MSTTRKPEPPMLLRHWANMSDADLRRCVRQRTGLSDRALEERREFNRELARRQFQKWAESCNPLLDLTRDQTALNLDYTNIYTQTAWAGFVGGIAALDNVVHEASEISIEEPEQC